MNKLKGYIGILLLIIVIVGIYFWEAFGREELLYNSVYVTSENLNTGDILTLDKVSAVKLEQERLVKGSISNKNDLNNIIGYAAEHFIPANRQIIKDDFDIPEIVLSDNEYVCGIPTDWIKAFPQSLRRKDKVAVFAVTSTPDSLAEELNIENIKDMVDGKESLFNTIVVYAKDSSNREVVDIIESGERMDASSKISTIELVMDKEKFELMNKLYNSGFKFVIMYQ